MRFKKKNGQRDKNVHVVERRADGIGVKGAKQHATGAYAPDETLFYLECRAEQVKKTMHLPL